MAIKIALITGASSGLGAEFARQLSARGYDCILVARRGEKLKEIADSLMKEFHTNVETFVCDLTDDGDMQRLEEKILASRPLDLVVNNAGFATVGKFTDVHPAKHRAMVQIHVEAPVRISWAVLPSMLARNQGAIINVASVAAYMPAPRNSIYSAAKMFLVMFSEALREEYKGTGISIQALCPGFTLTGFHDTPEYDGIDVRADIPRFLWMKAEDVVRRSLKDLDRGKVISIPGVWYRIIVALLRSRIALFFIMKLRRLVDSGRPLR